MQSLQLQQLLRPCMLRPRCWAGSAMCWSRTCGGCVQPQQARPLASCSAARDPKWTPSVAHRICRHGARLLAGRRFCDVCTVPSTSSAVHVIKNVIIHYIEQTGQRLVAQLNAKEAGRQLQHVHGFACLVSMPNSNRTKPN